MSFYQNFFKRFFDLIFAIILLIVLFIPFLIIVLIIKLSSKGPVFFTQIRTGMGGTNFRLIKFRSMVHSNDVRDLSKENEFTTIGKIMRKLSLDEMPQIINVLKGEMSFIGPRPWIPEYYQCMNEAQRKRVNVRPGITGLAQVNGRNDLDIYQKIKYDLDYVSDVMIQNDIIIIFQTFFAIFIGGGVEIEKSGIYHEIKQLKLQSNLNLSDNAFDYEDQFQLASGMDLIYENELI